MPPSVIRVVFDTNILMSYFLASHGTIGRAFGFARSSGRILASSETLAELSVKMTTSAFAKKYGTNEERAEFVERMRDIMDFVSVTTEVHDSIDPKDNIFLSLAIDGQADCIVSGDKKHLLVLDPFRGIPILSPSAFLDRFAER